MSGSDKLGSSDDVLIVGGAVDKTSITLAIYGDDLIPEEISQLLGYEAEYIRRRERRSPKQVHIRRVLGFSIKKGKLPLLLRK